MDAEVQIEFNFRGAFCGNMAGFKYPIPTQQYIHGQFVNAKGRERATLRLAIDDSVVVQGRMEFHALLFTDQKMLMQISGKIPITLTQKTSKSPSSLLKRLPVWQALSPVKQSRRK